MIKTELNGSNGARLPLRILTLSRSYPNSVTESLGLWVERLCRHCARSCALQVLAPVPYCPPLPGLTDYTRFRDVERCRCSGGIEVFHPRFLVGPGSSLYSTQAASYYLGVRQQADRLLRDSAIDLIHAHFSYPDGVVAAWLGRRYRIPVVVTEHAPWRGWMDRYPLVRRQAVAAAPQIAFHIAVSRSVQASIAHFTGSTARIRVIPIGVDGSIFAPASRASAVKPDQIAYVGFINFNKGIDLLLKAMLRLGQRRPDLKLVLVGGSIYRNTRLQQERLYRMAQELGLGERVTFVGPQPPAEVARWMRESALLVLPSRAESFGAVLVEALACGTPVVATRCGGPEDIVNDEVGVLVPPEDPDALAGGIEHVLQHRGDYLPARLREYALQRFAWERVAGATIDLYHEALGSGWRQERPVDAGTAYGPTRERASSGYGSGPGDARPEGDPSAVARVE